MQCFIVVLVYNKFNNHNIFLYNKHLLSVSAFLYFKKHKITWMLSNMKFISRVEQDISLICFAHS